MYSCKSYVESGHSVLNWEIEKFSLICPNPALVALKKERGIEFFARINPIRSPTVQVMPSLNDSDSEPAKPRLEWHLRMEFTAGTGELTDTPKNRENYIALYVYAKDLSEEPEVPGVIFTMSIIGHKETVMLKRSATIPPSTIKACTGWGFSTLLSVEQLYSRERDYLVNDALNVRVEVNFTSKIVSKNLPNPDDGIPPSSVQLANELCTDFGQLLESREDADLTFHCGNRTFLIHSAIIKARSPVIKRMFETDMVEATTKTVRIDDVDPADFEAFIEYIYTSKIGFALDDLSRLSGLVRLADKYEVESLKTFCFEHLSGQISLENAGEIAVLAYLHCGGDQLRNKVVTFCTRNWSALSKTENFRNCVHQNPGAFLTN